MMQPMGNPTLQRYEEAKGCQTCHNQIRVRFTVPKDEQQKGSKKKQNVDSSVEVTFDSSFLSKFQ